MDQVVPPPTSSVELRIFDPPNGEAVDASSVLGVEVEYKLEGFAEGKYALDIAFPALSSLMSVGKAEDQNRPLHFPSGRIRVCVPLRELYESKRVRWPLEVIARLKLNLGNSQTGLGSTHQEVASSKPVALNSVNPGSELLENQAGAVVAEYRDAVTALHSTILVSKALGQVCPKFPELEPQFDAAYQGWLSRNDAVIERVRELQRDLYERDMGRREYSELVMRQVEGEAVARYVALPEAELRAQCDQYVRAFSNPASDLETAGAAQIAVIQSKAPAKMPDRK